jgi:hypothetical protein
VSAVPFAHLSGALAGIAMALPSPQPQAPSPLRPSGTASARSAAPSPRNAPRAASVL